MNTPKKLTAVTRFLLALAFLLVACQPASSPTSEIVIQTAEVTRVVQGETVIVVETAVPELKTVANDWPDMTWDEVVAEARGQTVSFHLWGGNAKHNTYVSEYIGGRLKEEYGINLNPVLIDDTMNSVNQVLGEYEAGRTTDGSIDLIWINGNSFKTLRQADLLFGPYAQYLPNAKYISPEDPGWDKDFGVPVQGYESHWGHGMFVMGYDSAKIKNPPTTVEGLLTWICDNPGRFTHPALPTFIGTNFIVEVLYRVTGGWDQWQGRWTPEKKALWDEKSPLVWDAINKIKPCLWRGGTTYPANRAELDDLYANGEVDWAMAMNPYLMGSQTIAGLFPKTTQTFIFEDGTVADTHYVGIMANSPHPAAAMVVANLIQDPEAQLLYGDPAVRGDLIGIDPNLTAFPERFAAIDHGPGTLSPTELVPKLPQPPAELIPLINEGWRINVLEK